MFKMASQIENIISAYKTLSKVPSIAGGRLNNAGNKVSATWSVRNIDKGKNTRYTTSYVLDSNLNVISQTDFGMDVSNELLSSVSPKETYRAVIREETKKDAKKQYLEIWKKASLEHSIDLTALDIHGDVYADSEFGSLDWSSDETALVYIAERKSPKTEPYIKRKGSDKPNDGSGEPAPKKGEEYVYRQDWGEQLVGKVASVIVMCKLPDETITLLDHLPASCMPGQVRFSPDGASVVGVAWETEPRRLGLIFCTNRPSFIFSITLDGVFKKLSSEGVSVRSPRFSNNSLVWLQRRTDGPHHACHQLILKEHDNDKPVVLIETVARSTETCNGHSFTGLYCQALPKRCLNVDGKKLVFSTPQGEEVRSFTVDIPSGVLTDISYTKTPGSTTVLDVNSDVVLATFSNLNTPAQLIVSKLSSPGEWVRVSEPIPVPPSIAAADVKYLHLQHENSTDEVSSFSAIYFSPVMSEGKKLPLVVMPHGGPHSSYVNTYLMEPSLFNMLGFATLLINYRGSTGAGQDSVYFLPKRVGDADVKDCQLALEKVLSSSSISPRHVFLCGGSHGGFLVTHLSAQQPESYAAVVTRNPVTDFATMFNYTDINDWCAAEAGFEFTEKGAVSEEQLVAMRRCSPLQYVHRVRAPTALMLGSGDKRVPCYQGLEYARRLKANGVEAKVYMYDDNHSLSSLPSEMDQLINTANWFLTHMDENSE